MERNFIAVVSGAVSGYTYLMRFDLRSPLYYTQVSGLQPFACPPAGTANMQEQLFCFEIDPEQAQRIDPCADSFPGALVFAGKAAGGQGAPEPCEGGSLELSAGLYLFAQQRRALTRDDCAAMAIEQQKDGLWERLRLGNRLYIRCLFEDGNPVTQLFRPYTS